MRPPREIKGAVLHEKFGQHSTLIVVDEDYNIHTLTGEDATFHFMLQDVELPNFSHRRVSSSGTYEANRRGYCGYYGGGYAIELIGEYRERQKAAKKTTPEFPLEVWCENKHDFIDHTDDRIEDVDAADYPWLKNGKTYTAISSQDDATVRKGYYRIRDDDGKEYEAPVFWFRALNNRRDRDAELGRWRTVFSEFRAGLSYGFPLCCIIHYSLDLLRDRHPAELRGSVKKKHLSRQNEDGVYVPCAMCLRSMPQPA